MVDALNTVEVENYFKLPFEVYYSKAVDVTQYEFKSDPEQNTGRFSDVKAVHMEQGRSFGLVLACKQNNGPELYCCITNSHDEVCPEWLTYVSENDTKFNYGADYYVMVEGNEIKFTEVDDDEIYEDSFDIDDLDYCCSYAFDTYHIGDAIPDFIILDAENSRVKVNLDGYVLDEENKETAHRIFDPLNLEEEYEDFTTQDLWGAKFDWIKLTLEKDFPEDTNLKLSFDTE